MKKPHPAIIVALVVFALAGAWFAWLTSVSDLNEKLKSIEEESLATDSRPQILFTIKPSKRQYWLYSVPDEALFGTVDDSLDWSRNISVRSNQSTSLCEKDSQNVPFNIECNYNFVANVLVLTVYGMIGEEKWMQAYTIDLKDLGAFSSLSDGYLTPVAVAADQSTIYLGRRVETESYVAGLWKLDVATGKVSEIAFVRAKRMYQYEINSTTQQLLGVTFSPPESLGEFPGGPAATYLVDLKTGEGRMLTPADASVSENPLLSDDATMYATKWVASNNTFVNSLNSLTTVAAIDGVVRDWFGDTLVVDRDGNLFLYDLATKVETQLTHETDATVEYLGVVK